jgi:hypothetical protein
MKEDHGEEEEARRKSNNGINENNIVAVNMLAAFQKGESMEAKFRFELGRSTINMDNDDLSRTKINGGGYHLLLPLLQYPGLCLNRWLQQTELVLLHPSREFWAFFGWTYTPTLKNIISLSKMIYELYEALDTNGYVEQQIHQSFDVRA